MTTARNSREGVVAVNGPRLIVGWSFGIDRLSVPMKDHDPSVLLKPIRSSASPLLMNLNWRLAYLVHSRAASLTLFCTARSPPRNLMRRALPGFHNLAVTATGPPGAHVAFSGASPAPARAAFFRFDFGSGSTAAGCCSVSIRSARSTD